jgi:serine/threonine-protein kinase
VVRSEPKWDALPNDVPAPIRLLLRRCLEKDRKMRIGDISAALFIMSEQAALPAAPAAASSVTAAPVSWRHLAWSAVAVAAAIGGTAAIVWLLTRPAAPRVSRLELNTSGASRLALYINNMKIAISGDGSRVIYPGGIQGGPPTLISRRIDQLESTPLAERANDPFLSPDGRWLGYAVQGAIRKVAITGGSSLEVAPTDATNFRGATWGPDGTIVFATAALETGLLRVSSSGGQPQVVTRPDRAKGEGDHVLPRWLPGGNAVLFTIHNPLGPPDSTASQIAVLDLRAPATAPKIVLRGGSDARYVSTGHLVYLAGDSLWAVPFDLDRLEVKDSTPTRVLSSVASSQGVIGVFDIAADGTFVYLARSALASPERQLVWVDRSGKEEIIPAPPKPYAYPRISPNGSRLAVDIREQENDIWTWDLARKGFTRITNDPGLDRSALWLNDEHIIYSSMMAGNPSLFMQRSDGGGAPEQLTRPSTGGQFPLALSPDRNKVVFVLATQSGNDLMTMHLDRPAPRASAASSPGAGSASVPQSLREVEPLVNSPGAQTDGMISPDGRWLAYQSNESGSFDIYVRPFSPVNSGVRHTVSTNGGTQPRWSPNGRELFYLDSRTNVMMSVRVAPGDTWSAGTPEKLFDATQYSVGPNFPYYNYDIAKDGRFLMIKSPGSSSPDDQPTASLVVVQNWFEELKRLVPK